LLSASCGPNPERYREEYPVRVSMYNGPALHAKLHTRESRCSDQSDPGPTEVSWHVWEYMQIRLCDPVVHIYCLRPDIFVSHRPTRNCTLACTAMLLPFSPPHAGAVTDQSKLDVTRTCVVCATQLHLLVRQGSIAAVGLWGESAAEPLLEGSHHLLITFSLDNEPLSGPLDAKSATTPRPADGYSYSQGYAKFTQFGIRPIAHRYHSLWEIWRLAI